MKQFYFLVIRPEAEIKIRVILQYAGYINIFRLSCMKLRIELKNFTEKCIYPCVV